jgi:hypothetical protein
MLFETTTDANGEYQETFEVSDEPEEITITAEAENFESGQQTVDFSEEITADFQLSPTTTEATASGTVTNGDTSDPIEGASVTGNSGSGDMLFETTTDANGEYQETFGVANEPEEVTITAEAEDFESGQQTVGFSEEITADFQLSPATTEATASGTVTRNDTGDPIEGATMVGTAADTGDKLFETTPDADGQYEATIEVKATNEPNEVTIKASAEDFESASQTLAFSEEMTADFELAPKTTEATASGSVTRSDTGDPIEGAAVVGAAADTGDKLFETTTDSEGQYSATFEVKDPDKPDEVTIEASAEDFESSGKTVAFAEELTADFELEPEEVNVTVSGTVVAEVDESAVEGADVSAFRTGEDEALSTATSGSGGSYELSFTVLAPDGPEELRLEAEERRFADTSLTVGFSESITQDIGLPSISISTVEELQAIQTDSDFPIDGFYKQTADIDASKTANWNGGNGFEPIGDDLIPFSGAYDGGGFVIQGLTIDRSSEKFVGLFGKVESGVSLQNIDLDNVSIRGDNLTGSLVGENRGDVRDSEAKGGVEGDHHVGGLIGAHLEGTVQGSVAAVSVEGASLGIGGLVGQSESEIINSEASGDVEADSQAGGLLGSNNGRVESSEATGDVVGRDMVGGLVALNGIGGEIINSEASGNVTANVGNAGGLVGDNASRIESSVARGEVEGGDRVGGLVGDNHEDHAVVATSYSEGGVSGGEEVGGLVGVNRDNGDIDESFAAGTTSGNQDVGGLIGVNAANVSKSFWDTEATGQEDGVGRGDSDGATGLTTDEMQGESAQQNMDGFDFQETWQVVTGDYPTLFWEEN